MDEHDSFTPMIFSGDEILEMNSAGRAAIRASDDIDALLSLRASLRSARAGRGLWLLWTWLLVLSGLTVTVTVDAGILALFLLIGMVIALVLIVQYAARMRRRAARADSWLSVIDFRVAQLAARP